MSLDLVGLGSAIIDFAPSEATTHLSEVKSFIPYAGGSVSNILVAASKLGLKTGFIGCVGDDEFGTLILKDFQKQGVDITCVKRVKGLATGIAFYFVDEKGERHYIFYRFPGYSDPETKLSSENVSREYLEKTKMFHFSEAMLRKSQTRETVFKIIQLAKEKKVSISYDPNVRETLWNNMEEFHRTQNMVLNVTSIFMATSKEAALIAGGNTIEETLGNILSSGPSIVVLRERHQYQVAALDERYTIPIFEVKAVDTSGAGDVFIAGFLTGLARKLAVDKAVMFGSAAAAIKVMTAGTRGGLPKMEDTIRFIKERTGMEFSFDF